MRAQTHVHTETEAVDCHRAADATGTIVFSEQDAEK